MKAVLRNRVLQLVVRLASHSEVIEISLQCAHDDWLTNQLKFSNITRPFEHRTSDSQTLVSFSSILLLAMSAIPVDFTTTGSRTSSGIKCTCGKKMTGECNCERVRLLCPAKQMVTVRLRQRTPHAAAASVPLDNATARRQRSRTSLSQARLPVRVDDVLLASAPVHTYVPFITSLSDVQANVENSAISGPACQCGLRPADGVCPS